MFKQIFWKFLPRYGMKKKYDKLGKIENDVRTLFILNRFASSTSHMMGYKRLHIDPRGKCGNKGKVLCYRKSGYGVWTYQGKHKKAYIEGMNCKGS